MTLIVGLYLEPCKACYVVSFAQDRGMVQRKNEAKRGVRGASATIVAAGKGAQLLQLWFELTLGVDRYCDSWREKSFIV